MSLYTTNALCEAAQITYRQAQYWTEKGWLVPVTVEGVEPGGSGNRRIYDDSQVIKARFMRAFSDPWMVSRLADAIVRGTQVSVEGRLVGQVTIHGTGTRGAS